jgi:hypothetical protein
MAMTHHDPEKLKQVLTWIGVANQLTTTRFNQLMAESNLPLPQFSMLNHFSRDPKAHYTITQLVSAFQANQPAITKTGLAAHQQAIAQIIPDAQLMFATWRPEEIEALHQSLFRLKNWLDDHRDAVADVNLEE